MRALTRGDEAKPLKRTLLTLFLVGAIAVYAGYHLRQTMPASSNVTGQCRPDYALSDLSGRTVSGDTWDGQVVLVNFWAAWCPPCRREIPAFAEVREFYHEEGFEVVGVAIDDQEDIEDFLAGMQNVRYPQLIGDQDAIGLMSEFGNASGGLPFSVLLDRAGRVRFVKKGELKKTVLIEQVEALLGEESAEPCRAEKQAMQRRSNAHRDA